MAEIDLNGWHRQLHQITGTMALHWCRASAAELVQWGRELREIAGEMQAAALQAPTATVPGDAADQAAPPDKGGGESRRETI